MISLNNQNKIVPTKLETNKIIKEFFKYEFNGLLPLKKLVSAVSLTVKVDNPKEKTTIENCNKVCSKEKRPKTSAP